MARRTCLFCKTWCFVYRIVPAGERKGWSGLMPSCARGRQYSRLTFGGYDADNSMNPILEGEPSGQGADR